ncbi:hypothetical protein AAV94_03550 [Lampropedia cohaerens]|uniref:Glucose/Sorbosone dehydrogenase domain-containing protein n=1 Tax=Lampropedia cohaerens TaxID=1610491 RepID=A0A0U1Q2A1_9BURK|nr:PQQ-dependent sugar dehydrogenase [Lampropedia cohaerens]KKW68735.1 hypothetical protein AAV94_03550 [Lampropedia cohaerens]
MRPLLIISVVAALIAACTQAGSAAEKAPAPIAPEAVFEVSEVARFDEPWAMAFLPDGRLLVTERPGRLLLVDPTDVAAAISVAGVPQVVYAGQGGLGDVVLHPGFSENRWVYLSYAEAGDGGTSGAAIARARLVEQAGAASLEGLQVIWRQVPKVTGRGHYGHRMAFDAQGKLWVTSGDRQKFDPAQDMTSNLGKVLRLNDDGTPAVGNPFADQAGVAAEIWSLGHRNPLGIAFDGDGRLWVNEMGPRGGDELNLIERGENYGYPEVSNGNHYSGLPIPDHDTRPEFRAPVLWWTPVISPSSMMVYAGDMFPDWRGDAFIGGLSSRSLVRVDLQGESAHEAQRFAMGARIRAVAQALDGAIWVLEDGADARLLRLTVR